MAVYHFTQLTTWQLADDVRKEVIAYTDQAPCCNDRRFCADARAAAESASSNTSEGYARFRPADFLNFLRYARASLSETQDHLVSAVQHRYLDEPTFARIWHLTVRAIKANEGLQRYLARCVSEGFTPNFWLTDNDETDTDATS
jgi:four helix bundle protein